MKNRMIVYLGLALIIGLYTYDRTTKSEIILPAVVVSIVSEVAEKGPDTWLITAETDAGQVMLEPRLSRPDMAVGSRICITDVARDGQPSDDLLAPGETC